MVKIKNVFVLLAISYQKTKNPFYFKIFLSGKSITVYP